MAHLKKTAKAGMDSLTPVSCDWCVYWSRGKATGKASSKDNIINICNVIIIESYYLCAIFQSL